MILENSRDNAGNGYRRKAALAALLSGAVLAGGVGLSPVAQARDCQQVPHDTVTAGAAGAGAGAAGAGAGALVGGPVGAVIGAGIGAIGSMLGGCTTKVPGKPVAKG